jgi:transposase
VGVCCTLVFAASADSWFGYTPDRKGEHPKQHLRQFTGTLQADAYAGFEQIYEGGCIQEAACWAHVRRKFYDIQVAHKSLVAAEALERIGALYAIEKEIHGRSPEQRREMRNTRSRPLLGSLKQWLEETLVKLSKKSDTAMAVRYALGRWEALLRYCDDERLEIDNNAAERALRAVALGRKNYLFAGSDRGGESAGFSLLRSGSVARGAAMREVCPGPLFLANQFLLNFVSHRHFWMVAAHRSTPVDPFQQHR